MAITGSDRVFAASLVVASEYRTFSATEVIEATKSIDEENHPARKTVWNHLNALADLGVLEEVGTARRNKMFRFREEFDPSR